MKGDFSRLSFRPEKHTAGVLHQQGRVWLDADWNEEVQTRLDLAQREAADVIGRCGVPKPGTAFALSANPKAPGDFFISSGEGPLGRCYVDGILCELYDPSNAQISYLNQPDYIDPPPIVMPQTPADVVDALVYVETWRRLVTYLEDPEIREKALNGPDTATRLRTVVQVKVLALTTPDTSCDDAMQRVTDGDSTLTTLPPVDEQPPDPCRIPDPGSYTGRENHLYRVEIHDLGGVDVGSPLFSPARFKWSKNNAADAVQVLSVSQDRLTVTVQSLGRDLATALVDGNIVEICDDRSELGPARGHLTTIAGNPDPDRLTITLADPLPPEFLLPSNRHATLRRWDGVGNAASAFDQQSTPDMDLGDGVHIQFGGTELRPGDYWQFVARSVDGSVENLTDAPPMGIVRHRCPLALVRWQNLQLFDVAALFDVVPFSGSSDVADAVKARFQAANVTRTDIETLHEALKAAGVTDLELAAVDKLLADKDVAAKLSASTELTFRVIQDCRSPFAPLTDEDDVDAALHVVRVGRLDKNGTTITQLRNDSVVTAADLVNGIGVWFDRPVEPSTISRPTCYVDVELPFATTSTTKDALAYWRVTLAATVGAAGKQLTWKPTAGTGDLDTLAALAGLKERGVLVRLHLHGDVIWAAGEPTLFLDGDAFGMKNPADASTLLRLPTGDGKRGGDFEMWFWLKATPRPGLYVVDPRANVVEFYPLDANGPTLPSRTIGDPNMLKSPVGVAIDATGKIYVSEATSAAIVQFDAGASSGAVPHASSLGSPNIQPSGVAVDAAGFVYFVGSAVGGPGSAVFVFAADALRAPPRMIIGDKTGLTGSLGIAVAADGTVYVTVNDPNKGGRIAVFSPQAPGNAPPAGNIAPTRTIVPHTTSGGFTATYQLRGLALDGAGNLYVAARSIVSTAAPDAVFVFAPGKDVPFRTIAGFSKTQLADPFGIAVDGDGNVYVANRSKNTVTVYAASTSSTPSTTTDIAPIRTITGANPNTLTTPLYIAIGL